MDLNSFDRKGRGTARMKPARSAVRWAMVVIGGKLNRAEVVNQSTEQMWPHLSINRALEQMWPNLSINRAEVARLINQQNRA